MKNLVVEPPFTTFEVWRRVRVIKARCPRCRHRQYAQTYIHTDGVKSWPQVFALMRDSDRLLVSTWKTGRGWSRRRVVQIKIGRIANGTR